VAGELAWDFETGSFEKEIFEPATRRERWHPKLAFEPSVLTFERRIRFRKAFERAVRIEKRRGNTSYSQIDPAPKDFVVKERFLLDTFSVS